MAVISTKSESIESLLQRPVSKNEAVFVAKMFMSEPEKLGELIKYNSCENAKSAMRASYILGNVWELEPQLLTEYQAELIKLLLETPFESVRRSLLRIIESAPIPEEYLGQLFDICLAWMKSENHEIAVRANAMQVLYRICCVETDLAAELSEQIQLIVDYGSPGIKSRSKKILKKLEMMK
ncbi:MAG: hypothetical protein HOO86_05395 [Bacteroidales bacterium]|nr:hypothetical protein [Bacteroidales bacterium]